MDNITIKPRSIGEASPLVQKLRKVNQKDANAFNADTKFFRLKDYGINNQEAFVERDFVQFIHENKDLLSVIEQSDDAKELLSKTQVSNREDLEKILSDTAKDILKKENITDFDTDKLLKRPYLSAFIVNNLGGFVDILKKNPDTAKVFSSNAPDVSEHYFKKMAQITASMFEPTSPLADASIYENDPETAIFLHENPSLVKSFSKPQHDYTQDNNFLYYINQPEINAVHEGFAAAYAAAQTQSGTYSRSFYEDNIDVAKFVAAASYFGKIPEVSRYLNNNPKYGQNNYGSNDTFSAKQIIKKVAAFQAQQSLNVDHPISLNFLENNFDIAQAIITDQDLQKSLNQNKTQSDLQNLLGGSKSPPVSSDFKQMVKEHFLSSFSKARQSFSLRI